MRTWGGHSSNDSDIVDSAQPAKIMMGRRSAYAGVAH